MQHVDEVSAVRRSVNTKCVGIMKGLLGGSYGSQALAVSDILFGDFSILMFS